ncbi:hypothetical protein VHUM_01445 [Vanrija humicola]|uniref:Uncharacterized protein n=1 Tax=Vanrija humicola TaxID=5417 RepID=A0A7D8V0Q8_VANHU|nr:hypothetical protein VHUM_01445 [Vanrija humicola]
MSSLAVVPTNVPSPPPRSPNPQKHPRHARLRPRHDPPRAREPGHGRDLHRAPGEQHDRARRRGVYAEMDGRRQGAVAGHDRHDAHRPVRRRPHKQRRRAGDHARRRPRQAVQHHLHCQPQHRRERPVLPVQVHFRVEQHRRRQGVRAVQRALLYAEHDGLVLVRAERADCCCDQPDADNADNVTEHRRRVQVGCRRLRLRLGHPLGRRAARCACRPRRRRRCPRLPCLGARVTR